MAGSSLFALIDKIAVALDDVALMTKVAAKKTAGVLGDDLALNAQQVSGVKADREIPVVWAVAKGSFVNKLILVPAALLLSAFLPSLITPLLIIGGAYLCYEGVEKIYHNLQGDHDDEQHQKDINALVDDNIDLVEYEKDKIKGAIRTDFILSAEIIIIALGTVQHRAFIDQATVVSLIAVLMTIGVYGLVAGIVKIDDLGVYLLQNPKSGFRGKVREKVGNGLLSFAPKLMKSLSFLGTAAMFLVGGGILVHGIEYFHHLQVAAENVVNSWPAHNWYSWLVGPIFTLVLGMFLGSIVLLLVNMFSKLKETVQSS
ncbi:DUF808 domain-containing protein [Thalassotalea sp. PS06]|uniref:DUF808 domain-containing protein n=1 Tax=Thalassotalea sp. PS06 TaxID=2594005 RepID=UPI0011636041|nr:DUF808 domain-containing protein [Thalassotalea sp. PS06]QDP00752.1 DUF808 domain-containing protein [Thalassotalea sp. PS06]